LAASRTGTSPLDPLRAQPAARAASTATGFQSTQSGAAGSISKIKEKRSVGQPGSLLPSPAPSLRRARPWRPRTPRPSDQDRGGRLVSISLSRSSPPQRSQGVKGGGWMRVRMRFPFARDARSETMERPKGARLKGWIESSNALRWRFGQLLGCAFTETESSKIKIGNLPAAPAPMRSKADRKCDHVGTI
jgi:hypothetical protein